jgi:hypothetical protein
MVVFLVAPLDAAPRNRNGQYRFSRVTPPAISCRFESALRGSTDRPGEN